MTNQPLHVDWLNSSLPALLLVITKCEPGVPPDRLPFEVEDIRDSTASQRKECQQGTSPLVSQSLVHLLGKENRGGTPHGTQEGFGREGRGSLVLIGIHF